MRESARIHHDHGWLIMSLKWSEKETKTEEKTETQSQQLATKTRKIHRKSTPTGDMCRANAFWWTFWICGRALVQCSYIYLAPLDIAIYSIEWIESRTPYKIRIRNRNTKKQIYWMKLNKKEERTLTHTAPNGLKVNRNAIFNRFLCQFFAYSMCVFFLCMRNAR